MPRRNPPPMANTARGIASPTPTARVVPRRALPSGRALSGGFLVAVASVGTFAAYRGSSSRPTHRYVTAAQDIAAGETVGADDVRTAPVDLPDDIAAHAFVDAGEVVGRVALAPVASGELLQTSAVADRDKADPRYELSVPVERARALAGALESGELVDVVATIGTGSDAKTTVVAHRAAVVRVLDAKRAAVGSTGDIVVELALPTADEVLAVTHASQAGTLTIVRATGAAAAGAPAGPADRGTPSAGG